MSNLPIDAALQVIEENRAKLIDIVNKNMDALRQRVIVGETADGCDNLAAMEREYPLISPPTLFKGTKPTAVVFIGEKVPVKTWRKAYTVILKRCVSNKVNLDALMSLRNRISGRKRMVLSDTPDEMNVPIALADGLYAEAYFDTEWLLRILTKQILDVIRYDYSGISVTVIENRRYRR